MNWSLIFLGLVALSSVAYAANTYLIIAPKLLKVGHDNQLSVFIATASQPVEIKFNLTIGQEHLQTKTIVKAGETRNVTLTLPKEFPVGAGELIITGTGGLTFEEKRDVIIYDNRHLLLVQTASSTYRPRDTMEIRVVATQENLLPIENGEVSVEIYDASLKLVGTFPRVPIRSGLTETLRYPIAEHVSVGAWLVSATIGNTTSSVQVLVSRPIIPSFDLKAIFPRFLLRTEKVLRGSIEINNDQNEPIFGRANISIGQITEQDMESKMSNAEPKTDEWRQWKSQQIELAGRVELNYDLLSLFNVDITKAIAVQVYIQVLELASGQERVIRHVIPVFTRDIIYDIRPLEFHAGCKNEFEVIAKRPDGKPVKMEDIIVTIRMLIGNEQGKPQDEKSVEIKDFYTRGRNDIGFFNVEIPENCIGVLMTITPVDESGKVHGYRTHAIPLMPTPRRHSEKLSIELLPSKVAPAHTDVNVPVVSSQISTVGRTSNFYVQLIPTKSVEKFERLPMSYIVMTNGRITLTGDFHIEPTKGCHSKSVRTIRPDEQTPPPCLFNGTLPIEITREMIPYSTLVVYTFQPSFGFNIVESYRFSVAGLFQNPLTLNATIVPYKPTETVVDNFGYLKQLKTKPIHISTEAQDRTRVELSFKGVPESTVGLNVFEYDGVLQGLTNEINKERLLKYMTSYEQVPLASIPTMPEETDSIMNVRAAKSKRQTSVGEGEEMNESTANPQDDTDAERRTISEQDEERLINREQIGHRVRYPVEKMIFGVSTTHSLPPVEGDDIYTSSNMGRLYGDSENQRVSSSHYRAKYEKSVGQYDVSVENNDYVVATSVPLIFTVGSPAKPQAPKPTEEKLQKDGTPSFYQEMNKQINSFSQEALTFLQTGLTVVSDFESLRLPVEMKHENYTKLFAEFRQQSNLNEQSFNVRDEARQLLEDYIVRSGLSIVPPPIMLEEQSRTGYYQSIYFNTSSIQSQGTGKVVLPRTKPYSTYVATGFSLNEKTGLSIAQPIRLPTNRGLFVLANFPKQVRVGEHVLLTFGINNYLEKDLTNVVLRIRASNDYDLFEQTKPEQMLSTHDKDYKLEIPSMKSFGVDTRQMIVVPKRCGLIQIVLEVESEFGGDYEIVTFYVRESSVHTHQYMNRLYDLTGEKKSYGPIVEKLNETSALRSVRFAVSGTGLDRLVKPYTVETKALVGVDRALVNLYRSLLFRRYLNETSQTSSPLYNMTAENITSAYQSLQLYNDYDGSYSFVSDEGTTYSSLYLTSLAFGAMLSPMMPFRDNVTLNRTLNFILSHQQEDGSFDDQSPCYHYRFCAGKFRRESLTAIVLYSLTRDNSSEYMPEFLYRRLYNGEQSPLVRAERYLISRVPDVKPDFLTMSLFEMAFIQNRTLSPVLREKIHQALVSRKLTEMPEENAKYLKNVDQKMTFDDQLMINSMTVSLYSYFGDFETSSRICNWIVSQMQNHPLYDTVLDAVFLTEAWVKQESLFRQRFNVDKFDVTIDVSADNGEKQQMKINATNLDYTQTFKFTLPVHQITYSIKGYGYVGVRVVQTLVEEKSEEKKSLPFQLTQEFKPMQWLSEITARTCMTYTPTTNEQKLVDDKVNRTMVVEVELPSATRVNVRQIGFFLSRVPEVMHFTYDQCLNKLVFFINVPSTKFGKPICFEWCLERLSSVMNFSPIQVRVYDYLQRETQFVQSIPTDFQPNLLGYSFVDAIHRARPSLDTLAKMQQPQ